MGLKIKSNKSQSKLALFLVLLVFFSMLTVIATTDVDAALNALFEEKLTDSVLTNVSEDNITNLSSEVDIPETLDNVEVFDNEPPEQITEIVEENPTENIDLTETFDNTSEILDEQNNETEINTDAPDEKEIPEKTCL